MPPFSNYQSGQRKCPFNFECSFVSTVSFQMPIFPKHILIDTFHLINIFFVYNMLPCASSRCSQLAIQEGQKEIISVKKGDQEIFLHLSLGRSTTNLNELWIEMDNCLINTTNCLAFRHQIKTNFLSLSPRAFNYTVGCFMAAKFSVLLAFCGSTLPSCFIITIYCLLAFISYFMILPPVWNPPFKWVIY